MIRQNPGDKSAELSFRTQDLLEEASREGEMAAQEHDGDHVIHNDADDLSDNMSYDDNDDASASESMESEADEQDGDIEDGHGEFDDDLIVYQESAVDTTAQVSDDDSIATEDQSVASQDSTVRDIEAVPHRDDTGIVERNVPQDYGHGNDAYGTLQDLIEMYSTRNQLSFQQYERSLRQLHTKWEAVFEHAVMEHEHHLESMEQERHEMAMHIEDIRRAHENELEESKAAVMEQSQKIILEEMKRNADQEVRAYKSEEAVVAAIEVAVENARREMSEDFEIALSGMKKTQEDMKARYEKLVRDTEIRVRDEVENEIKEKYESKMASFQETYDDVKTQLLDQTLQIQSLEMASARAREADDIISSLENEIGILRKTIDEEKRNHLLEIQNIKADHNKEMERFKLSAKSGVDEEALALSIEKAKNQTRKEMTDEFDIVLSGMKRTHLELTARYEKLIKETEVRVRDEVYDEAKNESDRIVASMQDQCDDLKQQVIQLTMQLGKLEMEVDSKNDEVLQLKEGLEISESKLEEARGKIRLKDGEIEKLGSDIQSKYSTVLQLETDIDTKTSEYTSAIESKDHLISQLQASLTELEVRLRHLQDSKDEETQSLREEIQAKILLIEKLQAEKTEEQSRTENSNNEFSTRYAMLESQVEKLKDAVKEKEERNRLLESKIEALQIESIEERNNLRDDFQRKVDEVNSIISKVNHLKNEIASKDKVIEMKEKTIGDLNAVIVAKDTALKTKREEVAALNEKMRKLKLDAERRDKEERDIDKKYQEIFHKHAADIAMLQTEIKAKDELLHKNRSEYEAAILRERTDLSETLNAQKKAEIEALKKNFVDEKQVQYLQEKYNAEIHNLHKIAEDERIRYENLIKQQEDKICHMEEMLRQKIHVDQQAHVSEISEMKDRYNEEMVALKASVDKLNAENAIYKNEIDVMQRDHQSALSKLEEEHNQLLAESLKLISQLREEKDVLLGASKSVHSGNGSVSSSKRSSKRKLMSMDNSKSKEGDEALVLDQDNQDFSKLRSPMRRVQEKNEDIETPEKSSKMKEDAQVSPLTMASPLAKSKMSSIRTPSLKIPSRIPRTVDTKKKSNLLKTSEATPKSPKTPARATPPRTVHRKSQTVPSKLRSMNSPKMSHATASPKRRTNLPTSGVTRNLQQSIEPSLSPNHSTYSPPRISPADLEFIQKRSREGLFPCETPLPAYGEIRLIILNVPLTEKRRKMAKTLNIEIVSDPTMCTHAIVGDADNHIRRTAKLMAVLCVTPNILRSDWLDDCYKHKLIISPSHHTLLNDHLAEKAYSFSMKQTIKEGNERRLSGGLFNGWHIMFCEGVAGNKAPKEADLRLLVTAAGGIWLEASNVPVPLEEDPSHVIVITSDPATPEQVNDEKARTAAENGAGFFTTSWLFDCFMHQKITGIRRGLGRL